MLNKWVPRLGILLFVLIVLGLPPIARSQGPAPALPPGVIVRRAVSVPAGAPLESASVAQQAPTIPRLEGRLAEITAAYKSGDTQKLATFAGERFIDLKSSRAHVIMEMDASPNAHTIGAATAEDVTLPNGRTARIQHAPAIGIRSDLAQTIAATGAVYETAYQNLVQVSVPLGSLEALTKIAGVRHLRLPYPAQPQVLPPVSPHRLPSFVGTQTSQGVSLTNANTWQTAGYNGSGVNLAIFDFGFTGWATQQAGGDLPSGGQLVLKDFSASYSFSPDTTGYEHGTACAEIAYDMAPGATLYLYAFGTDVELGNAMNDYIAVNNGNHKVASMSIGWVNAGPYDGTGSINTLVNNAQAAGIFWANSAGNFQKQHYSWTSASAGGDNVLIGTNAYQEYGLTESNYWAFSPGSEVDAFLEWNDWNSTRNGNVNHIDYDMFLEEYRSTRGSWAQVASSQGRQCTGLAVPPTEAIAYTVPSISACTSPNYCLYRLRIARYNTGCTNNFGHWMELYTFDAASQSNQGAVNVFSSYSPCNSLGIPADGDSASAVGASFWNEDTTSPLYGLETFSSLGPRNASGGGNPGTTVNKPDVVAPDGVSTATYGASNGTNYAFGGSGFWGTSGAAPHVAGLAAVAWSGRPDYTLAQQVNYIKSQAVYKADGGTCGGTDPNNRYGDGRINLGTLPVPGLWDGGGADNNWTTVANWDDGRFPSAITPVLFNATSTKASLMNTNATVGGLTMDTGYGSTVTLSGTLTINGNVVLNTGTLDVSSGNYAITTSGNWTNNSTFMPRSGTVTFNGTLGQTIGGTTAATFNNLTISNAAGVSLSNTAAVNGTLALTSGNLVAGTGSNQLTLTGPGNSVTSGGGDVIGDVVRNSPAAGTSYAFNNPNTSINFASGTLPTSVTINLAKIKPSELTNAITRTYTITLTGGSPYTATLSLRYALIEVGAMAESNLVLWRFNNLTSRYELKGGTQSNGDGTNRYVSLPGVTAFSRWAISDIGTPTAVTLSSFNGRGSIEGVSGRVTLAWTTGSETNTAGFNVYRSDRADRPYTRINAQLIPGSADSLAGSQYEYQDTQVALGQTYYYQLEDVKFDGTRVQHEPIAVNVPAASEGSISSTVIIGLGIVGALALMGGIWYVQSKRKQP